MGLKDWWTGLRNLTSFNPMTRILQYAFDVKRKEGGIQQEAYFGFCDNVNSYLKKYEKLIINNHLDSDEKLKFDLDTIEDQIRNNIIKNYPCTREDLNELNSFLIRIDEIKKHLH